MKCKLFFLLNLLYLGAAAQHNVTGRWEGVLHAGSDLHMIFHISQAGNEYSASLEVPDQGVKGITGKMRRANDSLFIDIALIRGRYAGISVTDTTISGFWIQGVSYPLSLQKIEKIAAVKRPQTPLPPYPYQSDSVVFYNSNKSVRYGATITTPSGKGPFPAVLLLTGSGQQNRDEEIFQHRPFAVIADFLTRNGYMVMRTDDRGKGLTTGDVMHATTRDFAKDAGLSLDYLKKTSKVDTTRLGLLGHSEGGLIAQMMAAERKDIRFLVFLAAPGEKISLLMEHQNAAILHIAGLPDDYVNAYTGLYHNIVAAIMQASTATDARLAASHVMDEWMEATDKKIIVATTNITSDTLKQQFVNTFVFQLYSPWFRYFLSSDPDAYLPKINAKILALNGDKDVQVISRTNLPAMKASLMKRAQHDRDADLQELKGLNHLFQHCHTCTVAEYGQLEETFAPEALQTIAGWLKANVKK